MITNCPICGKIVKTSEGSHCKACSKVKDEQFRIIKEFLENNQGSSVFEVSAGTGISSTMILLFLKEGRLHIS
jgi:predicted O-methyltransferase YrrM